MQRFTSKQRKFLYLGGILALLVPVVYLGLPASSSSKGGKIAQMRADYQLGESSIGDVDPASASMNLMLLGLRGIAADVLWMNAVNQKQTKNWSQLEQTVNTIIKLQPHFKQVWKFQSWNLAYNVSAEFDAIPDRYYWVKKGIKFLDRGTKRNTDEPELYHDLGDYYGKKIGRADEWRLFRRYFRDADPDTEQYEGDVDTAINPDRKDNYLVSKDVYQTSNEKEELDGVTQRKMDRIIFRSYPTRSQLDYAYALQREGRFDEVDEMRSAWSDGYTMWTEDYGKERFRHSFGGQVILNSGPEEIQELADLDGMSYEEKNAIVDASKNKVNYDYWVNRSALESQVEMIESRQLLYAGKDKLLNQQDIYGAREDLEKGLTMLDDIVANDPRGQMLPQETEVLEDIIKSLIMWRSILQIEGETIPDDYFLKEVWDNQPMLVAKFTKLFQQRTGSSL